jgi:hypothetical protein
MMGLLSWITGESKAAEKAIDGVTNGLDAMFFTDEEKSVANQKVLDFKLKWAQATSGQNLARRYISLLVVALWVLLVVLTVFLKLIGSESSQFVFDMLKDVVNNPFMMIIGFYFLAHVTKGLGKGQ